MSQIYKGCNRYTMNRMPTLSLLTLGVFFGTSACGLILAAGKHTNPKAFIGLLPQVNHAQVYFALTQRYLAGEDTCLGLNITPALEAGRYVGTSLGCDIFKTHWNMSLQGVLPINPVSHSAQRSVTPGFTLKLEWTAYPSLSIGGAWVYPQLSQANLMDSARGEVGVQLHYAFKSGKSFGLNFGATQTEANWKPSLGLSVRLKAYPVPRRKTSMQHALQRNITVHRLPFPVNPLLTSTSPPEQQKARKAPEKRAGLSSASTEEISVLVAFSTSTSPFVDCSSPQRSLTPYEAGHPAGECIADQLPHAVQEAEICTFQLAQAIEETNAAQARLRGQLKKAAKLLPRLYRTAQHGRKELKPAKEGRWLHNKKTRRTEKKSQPLKRNLQSNSQALEKADAATIWLEQDMRPLAKQRLQREERIRKLEGRDSDCSLKSEVFAHEEDFETWELESWNREIPEVDPFQRETALHLLNASDSDREIVRETDNEISIDFHPGLKKGRGRMQSWLASPRTPGSNGSRGSPAAFADQATQAEPLGLKLCSSAYSTIVERFRNLGLPGIGWRPMASCLPTPKPELGPDRFQDLGCLLPPRPRKFLPNVPTVTLRQGNHTEA